MYSSSQLTALNCRTGKQSFEIITGYAYTASSDLLTMIPGALQFTECLSHCIQNESCAAVNFETGLCVLLRSSEIQRGDSVKQSQYPVFTIYAKKICIPHKKRTKIANFLAVKHIFLLTIRFIEKGYASDKCNQAWTHEKVIGYKLNSKPSKKTFVLSVEKCIEVCFKEDEFKCRSVNYNRFSRECDLMSVDRQSVEGDIPTLVDTNVDYVEINCEEESSKRSCEFKKLNGVILKTVDAVYPDIKDVNECRHKCLESAFRCNSFDLGDGNFNICRVSHLSRRLTTHIQAPYLEVPKSVTYEVDSCYNVSLLCGAKEMSVKVKMSKPFSGRIYAVSKPNSCFNNIKNKQNFEINIPYNDVNCGLVEQEKGLFSNGIVIQRHKLIVTRDDIGISVNCHYDLSSKKITHKIFMKEMGDNYNDHIEDQNRPPIQEATVTPLTVNMRVTDRNGQDIRSAEVGDQLSLRFEIPDANSPYEIFVREIIADDGVDNAEYMLIDRNGCPTDVTIMGPIIRVKTEPKTMEAQFEAFKFPTSGIVQFRALVVPCLPSCEPVQCSTETHDGFTKNIPSLGRRKRSLESSLNDTEEVVVIQTIEITDKFPFNDNLKSNDLATTDEQTCLNVTNIVALFVMFVVLQTVIIVCWGYLRLKKGQLIEKRLAKFDLAAVIPVAKSDASDCVQSIYSRDSLQI
ncbi:uncharacterized protein B4U80_03602 [Leptotrombidium deliense]|uniref:Uncharacterized protein n=1 Tax=Leptotrombidium deliense TaxID=299467 RepID=A0A443SHP2_9ACAR|nr:uncharacterized protein B4U80_03602 [Leptotrombidium deliense]